MRIAARLKLFVTAGVLSAAVFSVVEQKAQTVVNQTATDSSQPPKSAAEIRADRFAYPVGETEIVTAAKDRKDDWYNAQDFGVNDHLGEDWNKNTGGNTDCGAPVYAAATGTIVLAEDAGKGWGNVVIIEHTLADGARVQTLYGHLQKITKTSGAVKLREQIGEVGNANGTYWCHLHFELRTTDCPAWNKPGAGYAKENKGWLDTSKFIDRQRAARQK